jgi:hypothetical protein
MGASHLQFDDCMQRQIAGKAKNQNGHCPPQTIWELKIKEAKPILQQPSRS